MNTPSKPTAKRPPEINLFGEEIDRYHGMRERYGIWPFTVWDLDSSDRYMQELKKLIGDESRVPVGVNVKGFQNYYKATSSTRFGALAQTSPNSKYRVSSSIFNPVLAAAILNAYAEGAQTVVDPFAGGGTRAIIAAKLGYSYSGIEIRQAEVDAISGRMENNRVAARIVCADARDIDMVFAGEEFDFSFTCPPYYNLEQYCGGPNDLSMAETYDDFLRGIDRVASGLFAVLRPSAISVWVVGLHRYHNCEILAMHHDLAQIMRTVGFFFKEEIVLPWRNTGAIARVGNFVNGRRLLVRQHEYAMVFQKPPVELIGDKEEEGEESAPAT